MSNSDGTLTVTNIAIFDQYGPSSVVNVKCI